MTHRRPGMYNCCLMLISDKERNCEYINYLNLLKLIPEQSYSEVFRITATCGIRCMILDTRKIMPITRVHAKRKAKMKLRLNEIVKFSDILFDKR